MTSHDTLRLRAAFTALAITFGQAACGGGGESAPAAPAPAPVPAPAPAPVPAGPSAADYLTFAATSNGTPSISTLWAVDPQATTTPVKWRFDGEPSVAVPSTVARVGALDASGQTFTSFGAGRAFFVSGGQVFEVDLLKTSSQQPRRISSVTDARSSHAIEYRPLRPDVNVDGWLRVVCGPASESCYVRAGGSASSPPVVLPTGTIWNDVLPDPSGMFVRHIVTCQYGGITVGTRLYSPDLVAGAPMAGAEGFCATLKALDPTAGGSAGYTVDDQGGLRRMTWDAAGASVSPPILSLSTAGAIAIGDSSGAYFFSDANVVRINGSVAQPLASLPAPWSASKLLGQTPARILVEAYSRSGKFTFLSVSKSDGSAIELPDVYFVVGLIGSDVVYMQRTPSGFASGIVRRISDTGANDRTVVNAFASTTAAPVAVLAREQRSHGLPPINEAYRRLNPLSVAVREAVGMVWCDPAGADFDCRRAALKSINFATGAVSLLGTVSSSDPSNGVHFVLFDRPLYENVPFSVLENFSGEAFTARFDVPGSLTRFFPAP